MDQLSFFFDKIIESVNPTIQLTNKRHLNLNLTVLKNQTVVNYVTVDCTNIELDLKIIFGNSKINCNSLLKLDVVYKDKVITQITNQKQLSKINFENNLVHYHVLVGG